MKRNIFIVLTLLTSLFSFAQANAGFKLESKENKKKNEESTQETVTFVDDYGHKIDLRSKKHISESYIYKNPVDVSYIITISEPMSASHCVVHLSLQDKDGFEITRRQISSVAKGYVGKLKGNFMIENSDYKCVKIEKN